MSVSPAAALTLWLPPWAQLRAHVAPGTALHRLACRADRIAVASGEAARIARAFDILPRGLPVAALTRQLDAADALHFTWLRADPGHVRPDMASARLMACGDMGLSAAECEALLRPLKPLFGDAGCPISAPHPARWYLCLPPEARLPDFAPPQDVLGDDLFAHLPEGPLGQRWRQLLNEAQVILHNHPLNAERAAAGKLPVNTLWFWGAGRLPDHVRSAHAQVCSRDPLLQALARAAGLDCHTELPSRLAAGSLLDLRQADPAGAWLAMLQQLLAGLGRDGVNALRLDFGEGLLLHWRRSHRWRFWRRRLPA